MRRTLATALLAGLIGVGGMTGAAQAAPEPDIVDKLKAIPGMTFVKEEDSGLPGYRFFYLSYTQPADHTDPGKGTFEQRLSLMHTSEDRPMVQYTTGYGLPERPFRSEPTVLIEGNQVAIEHRYFPPSRPEPATPADWREQLTIKQSADDFHRLNEALRSVYKQKWISTGGSKGGMTTVYHRRFYSDDVDGSVPYVAPNDWNNENDRAYNRHFDRVVTDQACQRKLERVQREILKRRDTFVPIWEKEAADAGQTFHRTLGSADRALEVAVIDTAWGFWQTRLVAQCPEIPDADAGDDELYAWWKGLNGGALGYTDQAVEPYWPYYFQAATELGSPDDLRYRHLKDLTRYPGVFETENNLPEELRPDHFDRTAMWKIHRWTRTAGERFQFVYGENDPWGAKPFYPSRRDSYSFTAPELGHYARISDLPPAERDKAVANVRRWAGVADEARALDATTTVASVDDYEPLKEYGPRLP